jgi:hypothetical protein
MFHGQNNLATSLKLGCLWTVALQALSLLLGGFVFSDWRLCALGLPLGWLPILAIALRRPDRPSRVDVGVMFAGFPALFAALLLFDRWYFHTP